MKTCRTAGRLFGLAFPLGLGLVLSMPVQTVASTANDLALAPAVASASQPLLAPATLAAPATSESSPATPVPTATTPAPPAAPTELASANAANPPDTAHAGGSLAAKGMLPLADNIVIHKGLRRMDLMKGSNVLRSYRVNLGLRPEGSKEQEGDYRTPEGKYRIVRRNPHSDYFLSLQVSYPNDADIARARRMHVEPGGAIMIHGTPNVPHKSLDYYRKADWTDGCIAVGNSDMVEVWLMTSTDTPVEILP